MFKIANSPVAIITNYRTGSSALCRSISFENNLASFPEPHIDKERQNDFFNHLDNKFVVKFMLDQVEKFDPYEQILKSDCFKIKLTRTDKVSQIASYYIALMRDVWQNYTFDTTSPYFLSVDLDKINESINRILTADKLLNDCNLKFDMILTYEELGIITHTQSIKTVQPKNLNRIKTVIKKQLETYNNLY